MNLRRAFTLIELSVAISIIGILMSIVIGRGYIITHAKSQNFMSELLTIKKQFGTFGLIYESLPGDMSNAYNFWGTDCSVTSEAVCNGDGDNIIEYSVTATDDETINAVKHMYLAGLVIDLSDSLGKFTTIYDNEIWIITGYESNFFSNNGNNVVFIEEEIFTTKNSYYIDQKLDDGLPKSGVFTIRLTDSVALNCMSSDIYDLTQVNKECSFAFSLE